MTRQRAINGSGALFRRWRLTPCAVVECGRALRCDPTVTRARRSSEPSVEASLEATP
jgi:hypothetical protein